MILKSLTDNAKNLAANAKIEDMGRLFKNSVAGKQDVKSALSGVMVGLGFFPIENRVITDSPVLLYFPLFVQLF